MKISKVLKVLGAAAAVAALTPYQVEKDEETGVTSLKALIWGARYTPATEEAGRDLNLIFGLHIPKLPGRKDESELFADNEPEAAVLDAEELQVLADEAQEAADEAQAIADEAQEAADEAQAIADEAQEAADKAQAIVEDVQDAAGGVGFDPGF